MHQITLFFILCFMLLTSLNSRASDNAGRYQLFQGEYQFVNLDGEIHSQRALLKIDTATGAIYECKQDQVLGKHIGEKGEAYQRRYCQDFEQDIEFPVYKKDGK